MLADDFVGRIALDPLRAGIPVGHDAVRIEHVDGVVDHPLDQQPKAALAIDKRVYVAIGRVPGVYVAYSPIQD